MSKEEIAIRSSSIAHLVITEHNAELDEDVLGQAVGLLLNMLQRAHIAPVHLMVTGMGAQSTEPTAALLSRHLNENPLT